MKKIILLMLLMFGLGAGNLFAQSASDSVVINIRVINPEPDLVLVDGQSVSAEEAERITKELGLTVTFKEGKD